MKNLEYQKIFFESQDPDETVILVVRKHALVLASPFIIAFILASLTFGLYFLIRYFGVLDSESAKATALILVSLALLYTLMYAFINWLIKYLDILILTNKHLVIIRQDGLFNRGTSVLDLSTVQDVATKQYGPLQTFLGYGKVDVQTAGEAPNFAYNGVGGPNRIQDAIMDAKESYVNKGSKISSQIVKDSTLERLSENNQNIQTSPVDDQVDPSKMA